MIAALLTLVSLAPQQATPELLPPAPDGWRFERLDFPLSFAPDLEYEGFEELWFAPGMFDPESDSYFSYVLAIRVEEDVSVDEAFVRAFLERYYRGLCKAVGEGRGLEVDTKEITVEVDFDGAEYVASIDMIDAFVTGAPLRLTVELMVHPGARSTELFGIASPKGRTEPIWKQMRDMWARWSAARAVPALFNHLFVVPDAETYAALAASEYLRDTFAVSEERETVRRDMSYRGIYFYGRHTYFEFLPPGVAPELVAGATGLSFGVEVPGGTARLAIALKEAGVRTFAGPRTRETNGEQVPWFEVMGVEKPHASSLLTLFTLEYDPGFLSNWHPALPPQAGGISRRRVLARYAAKLGLTERRASAPLRDVSAVHLAVDEAERERLLLVCRTFGYVVEEADGAWVCDGPGIRLVVATSEGPGGITGFDMSLREPIERAPLRLGKATISFAGRTASLRFDG